MIDTELKKKFAAFIKANLTSDSMSEEDIIWILDECDKGNKPTYDDFVKARRQPKNIESEDIHCQNCKNSLLTFADDPCKNCLMPDDHQPTGFVHTCFDKKEKETEVNCCECKNSDVKWYEEPCKTCIRTGIHKYFEKKDIVDAKDRSMDFGPNMMRQEEFKIPDSIKMIIDQNMKPSIVFPQLDGLKEDIKTYHDDTEKYLTGFSGWLTRIETKVNTIKSHQIDLEKANHAIEESLESINAKLDILDQRMHDLRQHQILKDMKCVTQVKDISVRPEPKFKINDEVQVLSDLIKVKYTITDIFWSNGPTSANGYYYVVERPNVKKHVHEDKLIPFKQESKDIPSMAKEPPKFKVGDIVKVTNDSRNNDFFVCRIKWSEHSKQWNYLISLDLENISGAFWRMEKWLTKSEDHSEPLFNVGDKVKLKHGKVIYDVYSITYFMHDKKKVYRYKIGHSASTTHYENENRLIKA